jgi:hypothetical protein
MEDPFPHPKSHARHRCQRRGTTRNVWTTLHAYADVMTHVGQGATAHSISRVAACEMKADGIASDEIARVCRRAVVEIDGSPMTVIAGRQRHGRHYFRNRPRRLADKRAHRRR